VVCRDLSERSTLLVWSRDGRPFGPDGPSAFDLPTWPADETRDLVVPRLQRAFVTLDLGAADEPQEFALVARPR